MPSTDMLQEKIIAPINLFQQGKLQEAKKLLKNVLELHPGYAHAWFILGIIHAQQNDLQAAETALIAAIDRQSIYPEAYNNLGVVFDKLGKSHQAKQAYEKALQQNPSYSQALYNIANIFKAEGALETAIYYYQKALKIDPRYVNALINLGTVYQQRRNYAKAISLFDRALLIDPNDPTLLNNIGLAYYYKFEYNQALDYYQKALLACPGLPSALLNIAQVLQSMEEYQAAKQYFERAAQDPEHKEVALTNIGLMELGLLNFETGWDLYRNRKSIKEFTADIPTILPTDLASKNILLYKDQGLGDEIFFLRYVAILQKVNTNLTYYTDPRLQTILQRSLNDIQITSFEKNFTKYDLVIPVSELPRLLCKQINDQTPCSIRLSNNPNNQQNIDNAMPNNGKRNIAVTWQAGSPLFNQLFKRIEPEELGVMLKYIDANVLIIQRDPTKSDIKKLEKSLGRKVFNFSYINNDLEDTLAFLTLIDNYIAVSNTNAHLCAALGKQANIFVPYPAEWRWTFSELQSPWFPNFPLYRQDISGDWQAAIQHCFTDLNQ